ncbi:MAG: hypothetical protein AAFR61_26060 [Bacteroidota bacterium]
MKYLSFLLILFLVSQSCKPNQTTQIQDEIPPADLPFFKVALKPSQYTWQDMDQWYKEELPKHKGKAYYDNLQAQFFSYLMHAHKFLEKADQASIAFYVAEIQDRPYLLDYPLVLAYVEALEGYWSVEKRATVLQQEYDKNLQYLTTHFADNLPLREQKLAALQAAFQSQ